MIACTERDFATADGLLRDAAQRLGQFGSPLIKSLQAELDAWHAIALAERGCAAEARKIFAGARPLLVAQKSHLLLSRAEAALAGAGESARGQGGD